MRNRNSRSLMASAAVALGILAACASQPAPDVRPQAQPSPDASSSPYDPDIRPADYVAQVDNTYFPLVPGTIFRLRGETEDGIEREKITVTNNTKVVLGVTTTVVKDVVRVEGEIAESTFDWYAQDKDGNVWYFGEDTAEYENGKVVNRHGSWEAGVDGAKPGIIMNATPEVTDSFRQEYYEGEAEDMFWVVATGGTKKIGLGRFHDVVTTLEWNPLEPNVVVKKLYAPGVGLLSEKALSGGKEVVELVAVIQP